MWNIIIFLQTAKLEMAQSSSLWETHWQHKFLSIWKAFIILILIWEKMWWITSYVTPLLPLLLILFCQSVSSATISCIILDCSAHGSRFNTCAALNNSPHILFSWTEQNCLFRWDHITCIWHHIWCFCDTAKHCLFLQYTVMRKLSN